MKVVILMLVAAAQAQTLAPVEPALAEISATSPFLQAAISPDGSSVAYVEGLGAPDQSAIYIAPRRRVSAGDGTTACDEGSVAWSPDGKQIAFLSDQQEKGQLQLYVAQTSSGA